MAQEAFSNTASAPITAALTASATSFSVATGQGAEFPAGTCVVSIDQEIVLIASRSGDTFTVAASGRGFDGTTAAAHSSGATVELSLTAYTFNHLWQQMPDAYHPDVPPVHSQLTTSGVPASAPGSIYDNEFESQGNWVLSPSTLASGTTVSYGNQMRSHFLFQSTGGDSNIYTLSVPFVTTQPYTITMKVCDGVSFPTLNQNDFARFFFFVSDQNDPSIGTSTGNRFGMKLGSNSVQGSDTMAYRFCSCYQVSNGQGSNIPSNPLQLMPCAPIYFRITYDGTRWAGYYGDGWLYNLLGYSSNLSLIPRTIGFQCVSNTYGYTVAVDFVRVTLGVALPLYGQ